MGTILGPTGNNTDAPGAASGPRAESPWRAVPWRTIVASVLVVGAAMLLVIVVITAARLITWVAIAGFVAIVLAPAVGRVERTLRLRRGLASILVMLAALVVVVGIVALFVFPLRSQIAGIASDLPGTVEQAVQGRGPIGDVVQRLGLQNLARDNQQALRKWADKLNRQTFQYARAAVTGAFAFVTIMVLAFFFLSQSKAIAAAATNLIPYNHRQSVRQVARDASSAISGYMLGNLLVSVVAGAAAFLMLIVLGIPNAAAFAAFIAFTDLIPLVGATIGAIAVVIAAFLHNTTAGIVAIVFFVVYQQFENSVLQPTVMARTVKINPLTVLLSVLLGVALFGYLGAVLAIPAAGSLQVVVTAIWREGREARLEVPTHDLE